MSADRFTVRELESALARLKETAGEVKATLISHLFIRGGADVEKIVARGREQLKLHGDIPDSPDDSLAHRSNLQYLADAVEKELLALAVATLHRTYIQDTIEFAVRRARAQRLARILRRPNMEFQQVREAIDAFLGSPQDHPIKLPQSEAIQIRVQLIRALLSDQLSFIEVAKQYLRITTFGRLVPRVIGSPASMGKVGGKAAGMLLANGIGEGITRHKSKRWEMKKGKPVPPPDAIRFSYPESWFLRTDVFEEFLDFNGMQELHNQKYKTPEEIQDEYPEVQERFLSAQFPHHIFTQLRDLLERVGERPMIVRSSALLEDNLRMAFSGKYDSMFLANTGPLSKRIQSFLAAVKQVYASTLGPDPLLYRKARGVIDYEEQMGVLIQPVVGRRLGRWFCPLVAGVAYSYNSYTWTDELKAEDGLLRVVMGLGTRAVERVGDDYPRMVGLTRPELRPQVSATDIRRYSQRFVDAIDMETEEVASIPFRQLIEAAREAGDDLSGLELVLSEEKNQLFRDVRSADDVDLDPCAITLDRLVSKTDFPGMLQQLLGTLEKAYNGPVDVELAFEPPVLYILQCRPLFQRADVEQVTIPDRIPEADLLFEAAGTVPGKSLRDIDVIVFVDPVAYGQIAEPSDKREVARVVGRLNAAFEAARRRFVLMGPGRWGSNNIDLGVPVRYADIFNTLMLVEVAYSMGGVRPEVSHGTHFFQDLVEAGIVPLAIFPGEEGYRFADERLRAAPNRIREYCAGCPEQLHEAVRVCHAADLDRAGRSLTVLMDATSRRAVGYFV